MTQLIAGFIFGAGFAVGDIAVEWVARKIRKIRKHRAKR